jgi:hypothetical protein
MDDDELRAWARRNATITHGRLPETEIWARIATDGHEWTSAVTARRMTPQRCFTNTARTILGHTALDADSWQYAEGFAYTTLGLWSHHAWCVTPGGLVVERTWETPGRRYAGVTIDNLGEHYPAGYCQLTEWPCGFAWAPSMTEDSANLLFAGT